MTELICKIHAEVLDGNFDSFLAKRITVTQDSFEVHVLIGLLQKLYIVEFLIQQGLRLLNKKLLLFQLKKDFFLIKN